MTAFGLGEPARQDVVGKLTEMALTGALDQLEQMGPEDAAGKIAITTDQLLDVVARVFELLSIDRYVLGVFTEPCEHGCPHGAVTTAGVSPDEVRQFARTLATADPTESGDIDSSTPECKQAPDA